MSTRPEPQPGQTWICDPHGDDAAAGLIVRIMSVDITQAYPVRFEWPAGYTGCWERDMHGFSPTPETQAAWNQAGAAAASVVERLREMARDRVAFWENEFERSATLSTASCREEVRWFLRGLDVLAPAAVAESAPKPVAPTDYSI